MFTVQGRTYGIGALIALLVLIVALLFAIIDKQLTDHWVEGGFAALALAYLLP